MRRRRKFAGDQAEIDMTPMLDIVFIMLIFFIVTTSFVREAGLDVNRPSNEPPKVKQASEVILIKISRTGQIEMGGRLVDVRAVEANVESARAGMPDANVVVVVDKDASTGILVSVLDQARSAAPGANISVASTDES